MQDMNLTPLHIKLKGNDAQDLLHRISTINFKSLSLNTPTHGLILSAQGKIECGFIAKKISPEELHIIADDKSLLAILDRFTFSEKYTIEEFQPSSTETISESERIKALIPKAGKEYLPNGQTNPLEVNLKSAIHDQKGCYPGQEVIEKIISLGSPAKRLCLLHSEDLFNETTPAMLFDESSQNVGVLTSYSNGDALAIIKRTHAKEKLIIKTNSKTKFVIEKVSE